MSSMYKGLLTVVVATVVASGMILMTENSKADNKELDISEQKAVSGDIGGNNVATKNVATTTVGKQPKVSPPPPPGPFVYGAPDDINILEKNKPYTAHGVHVKKQQAPVLPSMLETNKLNVPAKPILSIPQPAMKQQPVVVAPSKPQIPAEPLKNVVQQQLKVKDDLSKLVKPEQVTKKIEAPKVEKSIGSFKPEIPSMGDISGADKPVLTPPVIPNIKLTVPKSEPMPAPNFSKPQMPTFMMETPVKPANNMPILKVPQSISSSEKQMPKPVQKTKQENKKQPLMSAQKIMPPQSVAAPVSRLKPSFNARVPDWQQRNKTVVAPAMKKPDFTHAAPVSPQNVIPSYQMDNPTIPLFYYYYPVPNWNNTMQNNWNTNNQLWPYYGYRLAPQTQTNRSENSNINNIQGQQLPGQNMPSPAMMQKNINNSSVNGQN